MTTTVKQIEKITELIAEIGECYELDMTLINIIKNLEALKKVVMKKNEVEEEEQEESDDEEEEESDDEEKEESDDEEEEDYDEEDDEPHYTFSCCGDVGAYHPNDTCSDCLMLDYTNGEKIRNVFNPQNDKEFGELARVATESRWIDIKPYSHNIVGLTLRILAEQHNYDKEKIKLVVRTFGLHRKGWYYLLKDKEKDDD